MDETFNVLGLFLVFCVSNLVFNDTKIDGAQYCIIIANNQKYSASLMGLVQLILQQDNDPERISKLVKGYIEENNIKLLLYQHNS